VPAGIQADVEPDARRTIQDWRPGCAGLQFRHPSFDESDQLGDLQTNPSPFTLIDSNAWQSPRRFYRAMLANKQNPTRRNLC